MKVYSGCGRLSMLWVHKHSGGQDIGRDDELAVKGSDKCM